MWVPNSGVVIHQAAERSPYPWSEGGLTYVQGSHVTYETKKCILKERKKS